MLSFVPDDSICAALRLTTSNVIADATHYWARSRARSTATVSACSRRQPGSRWSAMIVGLEQRPCDLVVGEERVERAAPRSSFSPYNIKPAVDEGRDAGQHEIAPAARRGVRSPVSPQLVVGDVGHQTLVASLDVTPVESVEQEGEERPRRRIAARRFSNRRRQQHAALRAPVLRTRDRRVWRRVCDRTLGGRGRASPTIRWPRPHAAASGGGPRAGAGAAVRAVLLEFGPPSCKWPEDVSYSHSTAVTSKKAANSRFRRPMTKAARRRSLATWPGEGMKMRRRCTIRPGRASAALLFWYYSRQLCPASDVPLLKGAFDD